MSESDPRSNVHYLGSSENKAWKNSGLYGIWTHDLCDTGAALIKPSSLLLVCWNKTILDTSRRLTLLSALRPYMSTILKAETVSGWLGRHMF